MKSCKHYADLKKQYLKGGAAKFEGLQLACQVWPFLDVTASDEEKADVRKKMETPEDPNLKFLGVKNELVYGTDDMFTPGENDSTLNITQFFGKHAVTQTINGRQHLLHIYHEEELPSVARNTGLVVLSEASCESQVVKECFLKTAPPGYRPLTVMRIQSGRAGQAFCRTRESIWANRIDKTRTATEQMLWFGTSLLQGRPNTKRETTEMTPNAWLQFLVSSPIQTLWNDKVAKSPRFHEDTKASADFPVYSVIDQKNVSCLILSHVCVGDAGPMDESGLPSTKPDSRLTYDSMLVTEPKGIAIVNEAQAYPMYLVTATDLPIS